LEDPSYWKRLPSRSKGDGEYHVVIEIPRGEKVKYEYSKQFDVLFLDRLLHSSVHYPENYGFIPQTKALDEDPLDVLLLCQKSLVPLTVAQVIPIGGLKMEDEKGMDQKVIAVASKDPHYNNFRSLEDIPEHKMMEIRQFFAEYKELEQKRVEIHHFTGPEQTVELIERCIDRFFEEFPDRAAHST